MKPFISLMLAGIVTASPAAVAAVSDADFARLQEQLALISQRLDDLAAENTALRRAQQQVAPTIYESGGTATEVRAAESIAAVENWPDRIYLDGDFRFRYETIDAEGNPTRRRNRIRARADITAQVTDNLDIGFGLASGGADPVSSNQTLGDGGSSKNVVLNLAYVDWEATNGLHLLAGKFYNPLRRVGGQPLMFDGDWTSEGIGLTYRKGGYFLNALGTYFESDTRKSNNNFSWGGQVGASGQFGAVKLMGGLGYYSIKTKGETTTFGDPADPDDFFGNTAVEAGGLPCGSTADTSCVYRYDYLLTQVFAEASFDLGEWPTVVFFDYVKNSDPSDNDTGWILGTTIGQAKDQGQMEFSYYYAEKEADSLLGLVTDSDFAGGGTDNKGHFLEFTYGISKSWTVGAQYFINETELASGSNNDYDRVMIDMQWQWK